MGLNRKSGKAANKSKTILKVILWLLIAVYTYNLPNARVVCMTFWWKPSARS